MTKLCQSSFSTPVDQWFPMFQLLSDYHIANPVSSGPLRYSSSEKLGSSFRLPSVGTDTQIHILVLGWQMSCTVFLDDMLLVIHNMLNLQNIADASPILRFITPAYQMALSISVHV